MFEQARRLTTWHYQWMIVHEFLPLFIGQAMVDDILRNGRRFYRPEVPFIPVEFQGAAYRFGHTMVRPSYRANLAGDNDGRPSSAWSSTPTGEGQADPVDLRGGARARRRFIGWQTFFDFGPTFTDGPGNADSGDPAEQADRHDDLHAAVPPAARHDRRRRAAATRLAAPAQPAPPASPGASRPARASRGPCGVPVLTGATTRS